ncbi:MAG: ATP-dependent Clp protease ATP-binding subunit [Chloroflexi bacterium]|nr:ATP-dependent Clp protease ATP-binding subunit [Chloroflexota bacterium]
MDEMPDFPEIELKERCRNFLTDAAKEANRLAHDYIGVEHVFIALTRGEQRLTSALLLKGGLSPRDVRNAIKQEIKSGDGPTSGEHKLTPRLNMVLSIAVFHAEQDAVFHPTDNHLLIAILQEGESVPVRKLVELGFDVNHWLNDLIARPPEESSASSGVDLARNLIRRFAQSEPDFDPFDDDIGDDFFADEDVDELLAAVQSPAGRPAPTPLLDKYGRDLNAHAKAGKIGPAIAREAEIRAIARTLSRSKKNNPLLVGDAGVGKTAVVEGLAYAIQSGSAPTPLLKWRIVQIEIGALVAGTSLRGQFEERLLGILEEAKHSGNVILFIDEIHTIVGAGETIDSNLDAANILKPALARGDLVCIGATTHEEYRRAIARDPALERRFRVIDIAEPSIDDTIQVLQGQQGRLETHHGVVILGDAIESAVKLSVRYLTDRRLPDKALDLLDEACTRVVIRTRNPDDDGSSVNEVRTDDVAHVLSEWTGIPLTDLTRDERQRLAKLENELLVRVVGQDEAVQTVADAIKTSRAGLSDPQRPIGVFLFLGPSGVGKTELARALASSLFGSDEAMLRLDMSEFHDAHTAARLIGSPPGYKDSNRGGQLTEGLRRRPYSVVLLDEIEKAAPEVFDLFLQVFDEGRISDAHGRRVDCRHAVFIMTSNIGTVEGSKSDLGFRAGEGSVTRDFRNYLSKYFRPEFINRLDEVITFNALNREVLRRILDKQLTEVHQRLAAQKLSLTMTDESREVILAQGFDPANGARPLTRAIERLLTRPLSSFILSNPLEPHTALICDVSLEDTHRLAFHIATPVEPTDSGEDDIELPDAMAADIAAVAAAAVAEAGSDPDESDPDDSDGALGDGSDPSTPAG